MNENTENQSPSQWWWLVIVFAWGMSRLVPPPLRQTFSLIATIGAIVWLCVWSRRGYPGAWWNRPKS